MLLKEMVSYLPLFSFCRGLSQELSEVIMTMVANCSMLLNKPRQPPPGPGVLRSHSQPHRTGLEHSLLGGQVSLFPLTYIYCTSHTSLGIIFSDSFQ